MITHITYKGQDYGRYWFVKTSPDVKNFTYDKDGLVAHPSDVAAGPVEEFGENGFDDAGRGGRFLKIGVGILKRDNEKYDRFHTYPIINRRQAHHHRHQNQHPLHPGDRGRSVRLWLQLHQDGAAAAGQGAAGDRGPAEEHRQEADRHDRL